jgi:hypothetical protein
MLSGSQRHSMIRLRGNSTASYSARWIGSAERAQTVAHLQRLTSYGVSFHSYGEPHPGDRQ